VVRGKSEGIVSLMAAEDCLFLAGRQVVESKLVVAADVEIRLAVRKKNRTGGNASVS